MKRIANTPTWVWLVIVGLSVIEPAVHVSVAHFPPAGAVHSGLHTVDTQAYRSAMIHYGDDFYSPYSACDALGDGHDVRFYSIPHHHLYGILGIVGRGLGIDGFLFLGLCNGLGLAFFLGRRIYCCG